MTRLPVSLAAAIAALALTLAQAAVLARPASHDPRAVEVVHGDPTRELVRECVERAVADAVSRVDSEPLAAVHRANELPSARG